MANAGLEENDPDELADEYRALGVEEEEIQAYLAQRQQDVGGSFLLWAENRQALDLFFAVVGSWQRAGMKACPVGLNEQAIYIRLQVMGKDRDLELYDDVVAMGRVAAEEITEKFYSD